MALGVAGLAVPLAAVRLFAFAALALGLFLHSRQAPLRLRAVLLGAYLLAYVFSPYWALLQLRGAGWITASCLLLGAYVVAAFAWSGCLRPAHFASQPAAIGRTELLGWGAIFLVWVLLQAAAFTVDVPWRGDEDSHLKFTQRHWSALRLALHTGLLKEPWVLGALGTCALAFTGRLLLSYRSVVPAAPADQTASGHILRAVLRNAWIVAIVLLYAATFHAAFNGLPAVWDDVWTYRLVRYPFLGIWAAGLAAWDQGSPILIDKTLLLIVDPPWLRIASLTGFGACGALVFSWMYRRTQDVAFAFVCGLAFLTLPLSVRYGAMLTLESLMLPFFTAVMLSPAFLWAPTEKQARTAPQNVALGLMLLLKENLIPFLGVVGLLRVGVALRCRRGFFGNIGREAVYLAMLSLAIAPYMVFRIIASIRPFDPAFENLHDARMWAQFGASLTCPLKTSP